MSDANQANTIASALQPQSPSAAAAIATLKQLIQSASAAAKTQQSPPLSAVPAGSTSNTLLTTLQSVPISTSLPCNNNCKESVTKIEQPPSSSSATTTCPFVQMASLGAELETTTDLSSFASANADLLTLARLSVNQASVDAINNSSSNSNNSTANNSSAGSCSVQEAIPSQTQLTPQPPPPPPLSQTATNTTPRNRRLLPRKTTPTAISTSNNNANPSLLPRKRVALPPLAVKPPKEPTNPVVLQPIPQSAHATLTVSSIDRVPTPSGVSEEAPVMTAALINSACPPPGAAATTAFIPTSLGSMLAKSRLLQANTASPAYISVQPRPTQVNTAAPSVSASSSSNSLLQQSQTQTQQHLIQRVVPTIRPGINPHLFTNG